MVGHQGLSVNLFVNEKFDYFPRDNYSHLQPLSVILKHCYQGKALLMITPKGNFINRQYFQDRKINNGCPLLTAFRSLFFDTAISQSLFSVNTTFLLFLLLTAIVREI